MVSVVSWWLVMVFVVEKMRISDCFLGVCVVFIIIFFKAASFLDMQLISFFKKKG